MNHPKNNKQTILGIVTMLYDLIEAEEQRQPSVLEYTVALNHWYYFQKTPTIENIRYGVSKTSIQYEKEIK